MASRRRTGTPARERIQPRDRTRATPLGIAQQREWAISRLRGANNVPGAFRVDGQVDLGLLSRVLTELLRRHEVLRSIVEIGADGVPVQVVGPLAPVPTPVTDLTGLARDAQLDRVRQLCRAAILRPFQPDDWQRLRIDLFRLEPDVHVCLLITDHAASDAWSLAILIQEIAVLYGRHGDSSGLAPLDIQFGDFAVWQRERFGPEHRAAEVRHWRQTLAGIPASMALPADRDPPTRPTYAGDTHTVDLPASLVADIRAFSEGENASLFPILLAASAVLLSRHLDQGDVVIGSLASGRTRVETEGLVGCFANPLPLRMRLSDDQTLREVVAQARDTLATALDHQDLPFDRLVEELGLGRESVQTSLSRMWINVITVPARSVALPGLTFVPAPVDLGLASVDLTLSAVPEGDRLRLQWQYMTELFDPETVALLADQFEAVLSQVVTAPELTVDEVQFSLAGASTQPAGVAPAAADAVVELFRHRAALAPYAPAVVCDGAAIAYAELRREADRLADRLHAQGAGPGTRIAIVDDATPRQAVAILGVLTAGGDCVPADPAAAFAHASEPLADAGLRVLATGDQPVPAGPADLLAAAREVADRLGLGAGDRFLSLSPLPLAALVATWLAGGAVVVGCRGVDDVVSLVARERVTVLDLPSAAWREWVWELDRSGRDLPGCLRLVVVFGDAPRPEELSAWQRHAPQLASMPVIISSTNSSGASMNR